MNAYLFKTIEMGPQVVQRLLHLIPESSWDQKTSPERFSLREAIAHLADWEPIWMERFELVLSQPGATIKVYDEGQFAVDNNYASKNPFAEADRFMRGRKKVAALVRSLTSEQFDIQLMHPEQGPLTLGDFANMIVCHDFYHVDHLTEYLAEKTAGVW